MGWFLSYTYNYITVTLGEVYLVTSMFEFLVDILPLNERLLAVVE